MMKRILLLLFLFTPLFSIGQYTAIPDTTFEQALINLGYDSGTPDGQVLTANISGLTSLDVSASGGYINDLTGIEDFTALTELNCTNHSLTSLDLTQNTALINLGCSYNQLTSLDVTQNTALEQLFCITNPLTSIDVTQNTALTILKCSGQILTSLDVTQNTALEQLDCEMCQLTSLDLTQNTALTGLECGENQLECLNVKNGNNINMTFLDARYNPDLTCIEVDDVAHSTANWSNIDSGVTFSTNCNNACSTVGIEEYSNQPRKLIRILDLLGRETNFKPNTPLIYQYDDGSVEKVIREN